ncbi:hypothetical protein EDB92DRAFT_1944392 [Lactarius akahatsu]|uniref:Nephrocystin 3-like N-terminal domain-containing protein n=1 Tax=Lactarius akahatsu TaxID=416441 RepID=A0AAD4QBU0_9AGAM|nr:hypothetical protein EDB92DRAFT_1944392 [Lactarius akahatsu]
MDKKNRLKKFFQKLVVQNVGKAASSGLVEALKQPDGIATVAVDQTAQNSDAAMRLQNRIESLTTSILMPIERVDLKDMPKELVTELDRLAKIFEINVTNCRVKISHGWFRRFIRREDDQGDVANMSKSIDEAVAQFLSVGTIKSVETIVQVKRGVDELREQNQIKQIISKKAENANHLYQSAHSAQRSKCIEGTRVAVLQQIRPFLEDTTGANLFWLSGIAAVVVGSQPSHNQPLSKRHSLADCIVASFFFSQRGHAELCDASFVFPTLAYKFSLPDACFRKHFKSLVVEPLKAMDCAQRRVFIVLDAVDECEPRGAIAILDALLNEDIDSDVPKQLKVLTTSRPEAHLRQVFCAQGNIRKLNLQDIEAKSDIRHYLLMAFKWPPITLATPFDASEEFKCQTSDIQAPRVYHLSFSDFIIDPYGVARDADLVVDVDSAEREVLRSCFDHLSLRLDRNMAGIEDPSLPHSEIDGFQMKVENAVSPELRYACLYWASHLMKNKDPHDENIWPRLQDFLTRCLLWWIETMALLGTLGDAAESMSQVRAWMTSLKREVGDGSSLLADLLNDTLRFLSYHGGTISFNALHVYHSALPFTPTETRLRKIYGHELETSVKVPHGVERGWDPTVMVVRH